MSVIYAAIVLVVECSIPPHRFPLSQNGLHHQVRIMGDPKPAPYIGQTYVATRLHKCMRTRITVIIALHSHFKTFLLTFTIGQASFSGSRADQWP